MDDNFKKIDFSFLKTFGYLLNFRVVLLLIYGVFLFDSLEIICYGKGIFQCDFSNFFTLSIFPFYLFFLITFGVIVSNFSVFVNLIASKVFKYISNLFDTCLNKLFKLESKTKTVKNLEDINSLYIVALTTQDAFLLEYLKKEIKYNNDIKKNHHVIYSFLIAVILNFAVTLIYDKKTILDFFFRLYKNNGCSLITVCLSLLLIPFIITILYCVKHSFIFDYEKIYFPDNNDKKSSNK